MGGESCLGDGQAGVKQIYAKKKKKLIKLKN